jgi:hypothetical protein
MTTPSTTSQNTGPAAGKKKWLPGVMFAVVGGAVGGVFGYGLAKYLPALMDVGDFSKLQKLGVLALVAPAFLIGILAHELGHVAGGKLAGFRFLLLLVGPCKLQRTPAGLRLGWNANVNLAGGLACMLPEDGTNLRRRMALFIAGGPVASLVLGLAAGLGGWAWYATFTPMAPPSYAAMLGALGLVITGAMSVALFAVSALPATAAGFATDGRRLAMLTQKGERAEREAALTILVGLAMSGVRAREYPADLVARLTEHADVTSFGLMGKLMGYYHALDRGEAAKAGAWLAEVAAGADALPQMTRESVHAERAYWWATHGGDAVAARAALARAGQCGFDPATKLRAEAAVARAEGDQSGAWAKAEAALEALKKRSMALRPSADLVEWCEALRGPAGAATSEGGVR